MAFDGGKHVMLSYNHESKSIVKLVYEILKDENIPVWFDEKDMDDNMYDSMAEAVSNASIICCFMTPKYENSGPCKLELTNAHKQGKRIIPCMVSDRKIWKPSPKGWLGFITSAIIAIDFSDTSHVNIRLKAKQLVDKIKNQPIEERASAPLKCFELIREKYLRENRIKRLMNEAKSFPIEQSYINLAIVETKEQQEKEEKLKQQDKDKMLDRENEQDNCRSHQRNEILGTFEEIYSNKTTIDVKNIFEKCKDQTKKVLVLGRAGIGKSTFCQYVTYRWAKSEIWTQYELVILIRLRSLTDSRYPSAKKYSPIDLVEKEYFEVDDVSIEMRQHFIEQCNKGRVLWILDGYDEFAQNIPEQLKGVFQHICEAQHHILTSRPYAIALPYDIKMEITGFTDENIGKYIEQFFDQVETKSANPLPSGQKLLDFLESNSNIWGVAHIPVNLELICSLWSDYDWSEMTVLTMTQLYSKITEWLCRRYLTRQNKKPEDMTQQGLYRKCNIELKFLEHLAFSAMERKEIMLPPELLEETENEIECSIDDYPQLLNMGILKAYDDKPIGQHIATSKQHYFVHLSFQEYFAARHLLKILKGSHSQKATDFINKNKYNQRFHFVFVFASGLLAQSDFKSSMEVFWNIIQGEPLDLVGLKHTTLMIECIDQLIDTTVSPNRTASLKSISQWLAVSVTETATPIRKILLRSLERANSLANTSIIQNKLIELLTTQDTKTKENIYSVISKLPITNPTQKLLSIISADLQHPSPHWGIDARYAIAKMGEKAATNEMIAVLLNALRDKEPAIRKCACEAFGNMGEKAAMNEVIAAVLNALKDKEYYVRQKACKALGKLGKKAATDEVITALVNALRDGDSEVERTALKILGEMGEKAATNDVIAALLNALRDERSYFRSRMNACQALWKLGVKAPTNEVIATLLNAFQDEDKNVRSSACEILGKLGEKAATHEVIAALLNALRDKHWDVRLKACLALVAMGEKAAVDEVIAVLMNEVEKGHWDHTRDVREALRKLGEKIATNEVIDALVNALQDRNARVRQNACDVLLDIGEKAATNAVIAALLNAFQDGDSNVRRSVFEVLRRLGEKAATNEVIAALLNAFQDGDSDVRRSVFNVLEKLGEKAATHEVIAALLNAFQDGDSDVRRGACGVLGKLGEKAATNEVITALLNTLQDGDWSDRLQACRVLGKLGEKAATNEVMAALLKALRGKDSLVRQYACEAFGELGEKAATHEVVAALLNTFQDGNQNIEWEALIALGKMGEKVATNEVIAALVNGLQDSDSDSDVRRSACEVLGAIGEKAGTNKVITALVNAYRFGKIAWDDEIHATFKRAICSYHGMKELESNMVSILFACLNHKVKEWWTAVPSDHLFKVFLDSENVTWVPLVVHAALYQGIAVTVIGNSLRIYDTNGSSELYASDSNLKSLIEAFRCQKRELEGESISVKETESKTSS